MKIEGDLNIRQENYCFCNYNVILIVVYFAVTHCTHRSERKPYHNVNILSIFYTVQVSTDFDKFQFVDVSYINFSYDKSTNCNYISLEVHVI